MKKIDVSRLTKMGRILFYTKSATYKKKGGEPAYYNPILRVRLLHPFGLISIIILAIIAPFLAMFTDETLINIYKDTVFHNIILW